MLLSRTKVITTTVVVVTALTAGGTGLAYRAQQADEPVQKDDRRSRIDENKEELRTPAAGQKEEDRGLVVAVTAFDLSSGVATIRVENRSALPILLQAQPQTGVGFLVQKKGVVDGELTQSLLAPVPQDLGTGQVRLDSGKAREFQYNAGAPPTGFRIGIPYSRTRGAGPWALAWSGEWEQLR